MALLISSDKVRQKVFASLKALASYFVRVGRVMLDDRLDQSLSNFGGILSEARRNSVRVVVQCDKPSRLLQTANTVFEVLGVYCVEYTVYARRIIWKSLFE